MQNYIINPSVFYWINVLGTVQTVLGIFGGLLCAIALCFAGGWIYNVVESIEYAHHNTEYLKYAAICRKWTIISGIAAVILTGGAVFIPGKSTSIEMLIAKSATFDNVNWTVQQVKEVVDYIVLAIKSV